MCQIWIQDLFKSSVCFKHHYLIRHVSWLRLNAIMFASAPTGLTDPGSHHRAWVLCVCVHVCFRLCSLNVMNCTNGNKDAIFCPPSLLWGARAGKLNRCSETCLVIMLKQTEESWNIVSQQWISDTPMLWPEASKPFFILQRKLIKEWRL